MNNLRKKMYKIVRTKPIRFKSSTKIRRVEKSSEKEGIYYAHISPALGASPFPSDPVETIKEAVRGFQTPLPK